jgi:hypothetical protein
MSLAPRRPFSVIASEAKQSRHSVSGLLRRYAPRNDVLGVVLICSLAAATPALAVDPPHFVDETATSGIDHEYTGGWEFYVGGGVAAFDCEGKGLPSLYFAGGSSPAALYVNRSTVGGALKFEEVKDSPLALKNVTGAYPLDIDGDGIMDLVVLRVGESAVYKGLGGCQFKRANELWSFDGGNNWTTAFSATWEVGQEWPTFAIGNYVDRTAQGGPFGACEPNYIIRPQGKHFGPRIPLSPSYCALSMLFTDWNRSSQPSLRIANDRQYYRGGEDQLLKLPPGQPPRFYSHGEGWRRLEIWGMGIASYDLTGRGYPAYAISSMADQKLQVLSKDADGNPSYEDQALTRGTNAPHPYAGGDPRPSTGWHSEFADVNNDGYIDLFIAKGNVSQMGDFANKDPSDLLIGQPDGTFKEGAVQAGIVNYDSARGAALVDLNLNGMLDLVVVNRNANVKIYRNVGWGTADHPVPMGNFLNIAAVEPGPNRNAVGGWIELRSGSRTYRREITVGGGHAGGQAGWVHFGIGEAERALVRVQWPDGTWGPWVKAIANNWVRIDRDDISPHYWLPPYADTAEAAPQK